MLKSIKSQSDLLGGVATGLCAVHCAATPLLFVAQTCSVTGCCESSPTWWSAIDYVFIGITFFAVVWSAKHSAKRWMKHALYSSWLILTALIVNEKTGWLSLNDNWKYLTAFVMMSLHFYNRRYCQCSSRQCLTA